MGFILRVWTLFGDCSTIDYTLLREFFSKSSQIFRGFKSIQAWACKYDDALYTDCINALCSLVNSNDLFFRENCWDCFNLDETSQRLFIHHLKSWLVVIHWNLQTDSEFSKQNETFGPLGLVSFIPEHEIVLLEEVIPCDILKPNSKQCN